MRILVIIVIAVLGVMSFWISLQLDVGYMRFVEDYEAMRPDSDVWFVEWVLKEYAKTHEGFLPSSWDDLISAGLVDRIPGNDAGIIIPRVKLPSENFVMKKWTIYNTADMAVAFGLGPEDLTIRKEMEGYDDDYTTKKVYGPDGKQLIILHPTSSSYRSPNRNMYASVRIAEVMKKAADSQLTSNEK